MIPPSVLIAADDVEEQAASIGGEINRARMKRHDEILIARIPYPNALVRSQWIADAENPIVARSDGPLRIGAFVELHRIVDSIVITKPNFDRATRFATIRQPNFESATAAIGQFDCLEDERCL